MQHGIDGDGRSATNAGMPSPDAIRASFPFFAQNNGLIYFDSAATTQMPQPVIDTILNVHRQRANAGRGSYALSTQAAMRIEHSRQRVASFLNGQPSEIIFTSGATDSLNTVALSWGLKNLRDGDEIMVCMDDHKSTVLPWFNLQQTLAHFGVAIKINPVNLYLDANPLRSITNGITPRTRLIALTHVHNLFGVEIEIEKVRALVGSPVFICLDASQSVGHFKVDVQDLAVDFLAFSGHKMFADTGVGILWAHPRTHEQLSPMRVGGGSQLPLTAQTADLSRRYNNSLSTMLESGTPNIAAILSMHAAIDFIDNIGIDYIEQRVSALSHHLLDQLNSLPGIEFSPGFGQCRCPIGNGIIAFRFAQHSIADVADLLAQEKICVRSGGMCKTSEQPGDAYLRASLHVYNTEAEIDHFAEVLRSHLG